jgi:hypothetical protein
MSPGYNFARLVAAFQAQNLVNVPTVDIFIQKSPGTPSVARGVQGLQYRVLVNGIVRQRGTTASNGRITVRVPPGPAPVIEVMGSQFEIRRTGNPFANVNTHTGKKERLRFLGYQIGHQGPHGNGVDNVDQRMEYERSVLDFQAAHSLDLDANRASIEAELTNQAGG